MAPQRCDPLRQMYRSFLTALANERTMHRCLFGVVLIPGYLSVELSGSFTLTLQCHEHYDHLDGHRITSA